MNTNKKFYIALLFLPFAVLCFYATALFADFDGQLRVDCDTLFATVDLTISGKQTTFKTPQGNYFQILPSHTAPPKDGVLEAPTKTTKATDTESWNDQAVALPLLMPCSFAVHNYNGPKGKGYVLQAIVEQGGKLYVRSKNFGPETYRTHDWQETKADPDAK